MTVSLGAGATLVLGGARSGKSAFAENLIVNSGLNPVYIATGRAWDDEMSLRIETHKDRRGSNWETIEEPLALVDALRNSAFEGRAVLVDCLTLWVTNLMMEKVDVLKEGRLLAKSLSEFRAPIVFVSNEVGLGIVPENQMSREFRDHAGSLNQEIAKASDQAFFVAAGLPLTLK